jgi:uncharacterized protein
MMPRDASFLLSRNRFNVAISRARCLAVIVASPGLLDLVANSINEMRLANVLCWAADFADESRGRIPTKSAGDSEQRRAACTDS